MGRNETTVERKEAAKLLGISVRHFAQLAHDGVIPTAGKAPPRRGISGATYRVSDLHAYILHRKKSSVDVRELRGLALRADCLSRTLASKLDTLCRFLGLDNPKLGSEEDDLYRMRLKVDGALDEALKDYPTGALLEWAQIFNTVDESYLRLMQDYTKDQEPWRPFLMLATQIMLCRPAKCSDTNKTFAYACMESATKHLRHVAFFYTRAQQGQRVAESMFDDGVDDEIIAQIYPSIPL